MVHDADAVGRECVPPPCLAQPFHHWTIAHQKGWDHVSVLGTIAAIAQRYGVQPEISFYDTSVIVENVDQKASAE
jgi:hypothetical protein